MSEEKRPAAAGASAADEQAGDPEVIGLVPLGPDGVSVPIYAATDRPRGLDAYFAPGGEDEAPPERVADERRLLRLLVIFVALLVGIPTLLTIAALVAQVLLMRSGG